MHYYHVVNTQKIDNNNIWSLLSITILPHNRSHIPTYLHNPNIHTSHIMTDKGKFIDSDKEGYNKIEKVVADVLGTKTSSKTEPNAKELGAWDKRGRVCEYYNVGVLNGTHRLLIFPGHGANANLCKAVGSHEPGTVILVSGKYDGPKICNKIYRTDEELASVIKSMLKLLADEHSDGIEFSKMDRIDAKFAIEKTLRNVMPGHVVFKWCVPLNFREKEREKEKEKEKEKDGKDNDVRLEITDDKKQSTYCVTLSKKDDGGNVKFGLARSPFTGDTSKQSIPLASTATNSQGLRKGFHELLSLEEQMYNFTTASFR